MTFEVAAFVILYVGIVIRSLASIIVVEKAGGRGLKTTLWDFARTGVPITLLSMLLAAGWLWFSAECATNSTSD